MSVSSNKNKFLQTTISYCISNFKQRRYSKIYNSYLHWDKEGQVSIMQIQKKTASISSMEGWRFSNKVWVRFTEMILQPTKKGSQKPNSTHHPKTFFIQTAQSSTSNNQKISTDEISDKEEENCRCKTSYKTSRSTTGRKESSTNDEDVLVI